MGDVRVARRSCWSGTPTKRRRWLCAGTFATILTAGLMCSLLQLAELLGDLAQICAGLFVTSLIRIAALHYEFKQCIEIVGNPAQVTSPNTLFWLRLLFRRVGSRWFGALSELRVPVAARAPLYSFFAWAFNADLEEVRHPLDSFRTFQDFFCRALREGARPVAHLPTGIVSPVDALVLTSGVIRSSDARIEQVKGATYSVRAFLGLDPVETAGATSTVRYVVLYLAPGNYHRFHAPCDVKFTQWRHFSGELLPLKTRLLQRVNDIFSVNERVVLSGDWRFGQMHLAAVAATNVGNIFLDFDTTLKTNRRRDTVVHCGGDISSKVYPGGVRLEAGDGVGGFRLGSTVVLIFEAPHQFRWRVASGDLVRVGQPLGEAI